MYRLLVSRSSYGCHTECLRHENITVFAQLPMFSKSGSLTGVNDQFAKAVSRPLMSVVGSAPYVESSRELQERNIRTILDLAMQNHLATDFHLDYDLKHLEGEGSQDEPSCSSYFLNYLVERRLTDLPV
jgi:hypothetical protein